MARADHEKRRKRDKPGDMRVNRRQAFQAHDFRLRRIQFPQGVFAVDGHDRSSMNPHFNMKPRKADRPKLDTETPFTAAPKGAFILP